MDEVPLMDMTEIRNDIDAIDEQMRELVMRRMDCSRRIAEAKQEAGSTDIYRADREQAILDKLGAGVPDERRAPYLALVRKVTETSRMYQYGLIYAWNEGLFDTLAGSELACGPSERVTVRFTRPNAPNGLSAILCMVGDYGFDVERLELIGSDEAEATFEMTVCGDVMQDRLRCLLFQLSKESGGFRIVSIEGRSGARYTGLV